MSEFYVRNVIEAALLASGRPLSLSELAQLFEETGRPTNADLRTAMAQLEADYENRGIELKETGAGFRIQVRRAVAAEISRLWPERPPRYSRAMLETLALIAYRQPITRGEIEAVRGVAVNPQIIKAMQERNWVRVVGVRDVPGRPEILGTTKEFLDYFGLKSLDELPPLAELQAMGDINLQLNLSGTPSAVEVSNSEPASQLTPDQGEAQNEESHNAEAKGEEIEAQSLESDSEEEGMSTSEDEHSDEEALSTASQSTTELVAGGRDLDQ